MKFTRIKVDKGILTSLLIIFLQISMLAQGHGPAGGPTGKSQSQKIIGIDPVVSTIGLPPIIIDGNTSGPSGDQEGQRLIYWVHGLNGDEYSWADAADATMRGAGPNFPARNVICINDLTYPQQTDMRGAAHVLTEKMRAVRHLGGKPEDNFMIGHSQGGITVRSTAYVDHCLPNPDRPSYGGFVTFGSPHQGAEILNNADMFDEMLTDMCAGLGEGPAMEFLDGIDNLSFKLFIFRINKDLGLHKLVNENTVRAFCETLVEWFAPILHAYKRRPITKDLEVGADWLNELESCENLDYKDMPKMAFYGVEPEDGLIWRTLQWMLANPNAEPFFGANDDFMFIDEVVQPNYMRYLDKVLFYQEVYDLTSQSYHDAKCYTLFPRVPRYMCKFWKENMNKFKRFSEAYQRGLDFMNSVDDQYKTVIGALSMKTVVRHECWVREFVPQPGGRGYYRHWQRQFVVGPNSPPCGPTDLDDKNQYEIRTFTELQRTLKESDGVVLAESARDLPDATYTPQRMENSSHMQMRNDENTRDALNGLYNGNFDRFFEVDRL